MDLRLMILPARDFDQIRLVRIPDDVGERDALRHATALIASVQEQDPDCNWDDIASVLDDHGFTPVEFQLGPAIG
ncbi:MAG: hypothetical protein P8076_09380 [Gammaproteobacteria bacterium]